MHVARTMKTRVNPRRRSKMAARQGSPETNGGAKKKVSPTVMAQLTVLNGFITIYNLGYGAYISIYNCSWPIAITLGKGIAVGSQVRIPGKV